MNHDPAPPPSSPPPHTHTVQPKTTPQQEKNAKWNGAFPVPRKISALLHALWPSYVLCITCVMIHVYCKALILLQTLLYDSVWSDFSFRQCLVSDENSTGLDSYHTHCPTMTSKSVCCIAVLDSRSRPFELKLKKKNECLCCHQFCTEYIR